MHFGKPWQSVPSGMLWMYVVKTRDSTQLKYYHNLPNQGHSPSSTLPLQHVVSIRASHLSHRPFEWEQWGLLPWPLFHESKDKIETWKEEIRPGPSQTQQEQHRTRGSHVSPLPACTSYRKGLSCSRMERMEELCWLYNRQTSPCAVIRLGEKEETNQKQDIFALCFLPGGSACSQRWKQEIFQMIT